MGFACKRTPNSNARLLQLNLACGWRPKAVAKEPPVPGLTKKIKMVLPSERQDCKSEPKNSMQHAEQACVTLLTMLCMLL
mmetsp:Transcript_43026/g.98925  ORF Transcript_43026/g.98925 Transcript_43026/m.98925 type:complete len:80 (-) Transcript_43026:3300-3539(-)|eukprot:3994835-Amphidinium_carterae.1